MVMEKSIEQRINFILVNSFYIEIKITVALQFNFYVGIWLRLGKYFSLNNEVDEFSAKLSDVARVEIHASSLSSDKDDY